MVQTYTCMPSVYSTVRTGFEQIPRDPSALLLRPIRPSSMEGPSASIPIEIIDPEEFQAIELAVAAAESCKVADASSNPLDSIPAQAPLPGTTVYLPSVGGRRRCDVPQKSRRLPSWQGPREARLNLALRSDENNSRPAENPANETDGTPLLTKVECTSSFTPFPGGLPQKETDSVQRFQWGIAPSSYRERPQVARCRMPSLQFKGEIVYSNSEHEAESAAQQLLNRIEMQKSGDSGAPVALGFDTEWKVIFRRGAQRHKVSVLQLCADLNSCYVFHIIHSGIPSVLQTILEDPSIAKVGVCAHGDARKLLSDYGVNVKGVKDLSGIANIKLKGSDNILASNKSWSLSSLAVELLGKQVEKTGAVRMGDWEVHKLSALQLHYAATDAFASLHLFQVLLTFPDP